MLAWVFFGSISGAGGWIAAGLVFGGSLLLASPSGFSAGWGALLILLACVFWGLDNNLTALIDGFTPAQSTLAKGTVAGVVNLALGTLVETHPETAGLVTALRGGRAGLRGVPGPLGCAAGARRRITRSQMVFSTAPGWRRCARGCS